MPTDTNAVSGSAMAFKRTSFNLAGYANRKLKPMKWISLILLPLAFACKDNNIKAHLPSQVYHFVNIDTAALANKRSVYVPVYAHIYTEDGTRALNLSATLSIRNTSFIDSFYVTHVTYYGSQGEALRQYIDKAVVVKPMSSIEFVVSRMESKGGAGANFVVKWGAAATRNEPLIQAVMNEVSAGVSFVTSGVEIR